MLAIMESGFVKNGVTNADMNAAMSVVTNAAMNAGTIVIMADNRL